jgi:MFS family permease
MPIALVSSLLYLGQPLVRSLTTIIILPVSLRRSNSLLNSLWPGVAQLFLGGTLAGFLGRLWALRISIVIMIVGVVVQSVPNTFGVLILGRLLSGLGFGCVYIATSLYGKTLSPTTSNAVYNAGGS